MVVFLIILAVAGFLAPVWILVCALRDERLHDERMSQYLAYCSEIHAE